MVYNLGVVGALDFSKDFDYVAQVLSSLRLGGNVAILGEALVVAGDQAALYGNNHLSHSSQLLGGVDIPAMATALLAFWDGMEEKTHLLIQHAALLRKPVMVVYCPKDELGVYREASERRVLKYLSIWTDASISQKQKLHGYGWILRNSTGELEYSEGERKELVSAPRAELEAIRRALQSVEEARRKNSCIDLTTDSEWSIMSLHARLGRPPLPGKAAYRHFAPETLTQIQPVEQLIQEFGYVNFRHVHGHRGHPENERCDVLARQGREALQ